MSSCCLSSTLEVIPLSGSSLDFPVSTSGSFLVDLVVFCFFEGAFFVPLGASCFAELLLDLVVTIFVAVSSEVYLCGGDEQSDVARGSRNGFSADGIELLGSVYLRKDLDETISFELGWSVASNP